MKHRLIVAIASLVLAALILLLLPASPGGPGDGTSPWLPHFSRPTHSTTGSQPPEELGAVRLYSCDEATIALFTQLAAEYTALTGVEVTVLTPSQADCAASLEEHLESEAPPAVLCVHSQSQLVSWQHRLLDLSDTALAAQLCNTGLGLRIGNRLLGIPVALEAYGLLMNAELLGTKGALSRRDIFDMASLSTAVTILKNNSIKAFPTASLSLQDAWCLLMQEDLEALRAFLDLYLANGSQSGDAREQFLNGQAAFCLGGSWEYAALEAIRDAQLHTRNLDILPTFAAGGMQYVCDRVWCVNAAAKQADIDAALDFLTWMVTAGEGTPAPIDRLQTLSPFLGAAWYGNQLEKKLQGYMRTENAVLQWKTVDRAASSLHLALSTYLADNSDSNWDALCQAVEKWKTDNHYETGKDARL